MTPPSEAPSDGSSGFTPASQSDLQHFLTDNSSGPKQALMPLGGGTALSFGGALSRSAAAIDLTRLDRVVDFPARDMTLTVESGIRLSRLAEILAAEGQRLPIDIAQADRATLGGAIATNTNGPRRFGYGTFRDYVIGLTAMTADGRVFHSGGRVVKNVAGYDLCKLVVGSLGTLAVITQVTLKLKPKAESSVLVWATFDTLSAREAAVEGLLKSETRPVAIDALNPAAAGTLQGGSRIAVPAEEWTLVVGFEGSKRETDWQVETLRQELSSHGPKSVTEVCECDADRLWKALVEFPAVAAGTTIQTTLRPSQLAEFEEQASRFGLATVGRAGDGILIGRITDAMKGASSPLEVVTALADWTRQNGGSLVLLSSDVAALPSLAFRFGPSDGTSLMRGLKATFDPAGLLNPGRLFATDGT
ncbi:MAG TPA: FAD-binding oxidoreductase [Planctomycetaceae bacterium]|nr:FAD-binding oxidoreductase [Planctomycetaceae bacterium]